MEYLRGKNEDVIEIELRDLFKRYSADTIASIAFGIDCNSYKDETNDFMRMGAELTDFGGLQKLKRLLYTVNPKIAKVIFSFLNKSIFVKHFLIWNYEAKSEYILGRVLRIWKA